MYPIEGKSRFELENEKTKDNTVVVEDTVYWKRNRLYAYHRILGLGWWRSSGKVVASQFNGEVQSRKWEIGSGNSEFSDFRLPKTVMRREDDSLWNEISLFLRL